MYTMNFDKVMDSLEPDQHLDVDLTIIFTDIRGFSKRVEREETMHGLHAAFRLKQEHDELLRRHLDHNSYVKSLGDGCLFLFQKVCAPIKDVIALQVTFRDRNKVVPPDQQLEIGVGIHFGPVHIGPGNALTRWQSDPLSNAVNLAQRVTETAPPGTIHLTDAVYKHCKLESNAPGLLPRGGSLNDLGEIRLKGRQQRCHIWQINPFGARRSPRRTRTWLPVSKKQQRPLVIGAIGTLAAILLANLRQRHKGQDDDERG